MPKIDTAIRPLPFVFDVVCFRFAGFPPDRVPCGGTVGRARAAREWDQVEPMPNTSRPFVSFKAGSNYYFIQGHDMADKVLLKVLLGRELKGHEKMQTSGKEEASS